MIDFTSCYRNKYKAYGGANGNKINIIYEGNSYMLKFPPKPKTNKEISYANSSISEYISCHIFEALGFLAQQTILGTFTNSNGRTNIVVACGDFTSDSKKLIEFAELKNTCVDSLQNGYGTELGSIVEAIQEQVLISSVTLMDFFWDMFIMDAFLGNFDRHNGNWGILVDEAMETVEIAPIYDCGSCLYPQLSLEDIERIINDKREIDKRIFVYPTSAIQEDGKKINYFDFISSHKNIDCTSALIRVSKKLDIDKINNIIDHTPFIQPIQKEFYKMILLERKIRIIDFSLKGAVTDKLI